MKVLIIPSWYPVKNNSNSGIFFKEQAIALQKFGLDVTVAYPEIWSLKNLMNNKEKKGFTKIREDNLLTYRKKGYCYFPKVKSAPRIIYYKWLKKIINEYIKEFGKPNILHAHSIIWGGWAASQISKEYNIPLVITEHSSAYGRGLINDYQVPYIKEALKIAKKVIVVSNELKKELKKFMVEGEIEVIPNIVDLSRFKPGLKHSNTDKFRFFSLAFLNYNKGMDILIKAFAMSFKGDNNIELVIGGDGKERANLESLVSNEGVQDQVYFIGELPRDRVVKEMQECNSFVLSSRFETFGVVFVEALACGKPIIATKCGGPEMIVNDNNGLLCDVNDYKSLSEQLLHMYNNINNYDPKTIVQDCHIYSTNAVCTKIKNCYEETIASYNSFTTT